MESAAGKGLYVFHSCSTPPLLSSTKHIVESEGGPKKWIAVTPTCSHSLTAKQNLTTAFKMQSHSRRCTVKEAYESKACYPSTDEELNPLYRGSEGKSMGIDTKTVGSCQQTHSRTQKE